MALEITGFATVIVSVNIAVPVPPVFVALIVTLVTLADVGAPEITPVTVLTLNPLGKVEVL